MPSSGAPPLQSGGLTQKWPTNGQDGYITLAISGSTSTSERGPESEVAHKWARWLHNPCRLGELIRFRGGGLTQRWPTNGQGGYMTPAVPGSPSISEQRTRSEVTQKWARWLHNPCRLGEPLRFRAGARIRIGPQMGKLAT